MTTISFQQMLRKFVAEHPAEARALAISFAQHLPLAGADGRIKAAVRAAEQYLRGAASARDVEFHRNLNGDVLNYHAGRPWGTQSAEWLLARAASRVVEVAFAEEAGLRAAVANFADCAVAAARTGRAEREWQTAELNRAMSEVTH